MKNIEIIPLTGIKFNDANDKIINFSASREDVENLLGTPYGAYEAQANSLYYFNNELRFDFDGDGKLEFIEFLAGTDGEIQPQIYGVSAFQVKADELYNILSRENNGAIEDHENGYSYSFLNISTGVFREAIPADIQEMIKEAAADGNPMDTEAIKYETKKAEHWSAIGIGIKNYYKHK